MFPALECSYSGFQVFFNYSTTRVLKFIKVLKVFARKVKSFLKQPVLTKLGFIPCWFLLGIARWVTFKIPFARIAPKLGTHVGVAPWIPILTREQEQKALILGRLVRLTARYTPWDSNCLPQAIVARSLLGLYHIPYALCFGLMFDPDTHEMKAHAWVATGRIQVVGGNSFSQFTVVGCFVDPRFENIELQG
ncbi:MAG: lasso peptide biosynthesis B2 protein [Pseudomonadales bacterium]|nr:lasso peptide biosynthesis B2 protein [Pseudomonadales bacterium]